MHKHTNVTRSLCQGLGESCVLLRCELVAWLSQAHTAGWWEEGTASGCDRATSSGLCSQTLWCCPVNYRANAAIRHNLLTYSFITTAQITIMLTLVRGCHSATVISLRFAVNHAQTFNLKRQHLIINYCKSGWWHISLFESESGPVSQTSQNTGLTVLCFDEIWWKTAPFYAEDMS